MKKYITFSVYCFFICSCNQVPKVLHGTFTHERITYGIVQLTERDLLVQFSNPLRAKINRVDFATKGRSNEDVEIEWTCGLRKDFSIVRCSTGAEIFNDQKIFELEDKGYYTVKFLFKKVIDITNTETIDIIIIQNEKILKVPVSLK